MSENSTKSRHNSILRSFRKIHRITASFLFVFFFLVSVTGLLLGWKKNSGGLIQAKTYSGTSADLKEWLPLDTLHIIACKILHDSVSPGISTELDRIDIRKEKGMVKFVFVDRYWGIQLDGATGRLLHIERRRSDFIENIHDGSLFDHIFKTNNGLIKLVYTSILGLALLTFTFTGFWLWYGPRRNRKKSLRESP